MQSFYENIERFGDSVALVKECGDRVTYRQLSSDGDAAIERVEPRNLLFLVCRNTIPAVSIYLSCLRKGVVPVLINEDMSEDFFSSLAERYQPAYICAPKDCQVKLADCVQAVSHYYDYAVCRTKYTSDYKIHPELALLLTTSGSTGSPKLVRQSYRNISSNADSIAEYLNIQEHDRAISTLPMSYTYGLSIINSHILRGASVILNNYTLVQKDFWALLKQEKATTFGGVPYTYEILKKLKFATMDLPSLRYLTQAGGRLSMELTEEFCRISQEKGIKFIVMYGQTEATARMSWLPWEFTPKKIGSIGTAIPGGHFSLSDDDGHEILQADTTGELVYKGPNVTMGYAEGYDDLKLGDQNGGILHTGDMAKRDVDGFYYIVGRKKRFLKLFGNRVNLDETEEMLKKEGWDCACSGVDDHMRIYTCLHGKDSELIAFISEKTGLHRSAFEVVCIENLPRNESGKILYSSLP